MRSIQHYRCTSCGAKFIAKPGPTRCAYCRHNYVLWCSWGWGNWPWPEADGSVHGAT